MACFLSIILVVFAPNLTKAEPVFKDTHSAVRAVAQKLSDNLSENRLHVVIDTLNLKGSQISSEFADRFLDLLQAELKQPKYQHDFIAVERQGTTRSLVRTRGGSGFLRIDDTTALEKESSPSASHDVLLSGTYKQSQDQQSVIVSIKLEKSDGSMISDASVLLQRSSIQEPLEPQNKDLIQKTIRKVDASSKPVSDFKLNLWVDKGNGGIYRSGQEVKLLFRSEVDCYLKVLYIDVNGNRILMFPTERDSKTKLSAAVVHELHKNNKYTISSPFGSEVIIAFASTEPFPETTEINIGGGYRGFANDQPTSDIVNGLRGMIVGAQGEYAKKSEARVFITTLP